MFGSHEMPATPAQELLQQVRDAIEAVLTRGQDVSVGGKRYTRANLSELRDLRRELENQVRRESTGGIRMRRGVPLE